MSESDEFRKLDERRFSALWRTLTAAAKAKQEWDSARTQAVAMAREVSGAPEREILNSIEQGALEGSIGRDGVNRLFHRARVAPEIGDEMEDGMILAGYHEGKPLYARPEDAPVTMTWQQASKYASRLDASGHRDWRVPTKGELNVLYENRNKGGLKGTFNETGAQLDGWYWSSTPSPLNFLWAQRFSDGIETDSSRLNELSLRLVR